MRKPLEPEKQELLLRSDEQQVDPVVKGWLENVLVPAMIEQYIVEKRRGQGR
jgi:hypothetical protein